MNAAVTVGDRLAEARALGLDRLDAQLLLCHVLGCARSWLLAHDDEPLTVAQSLAIDAAFARRAVGEPLAYVVGEKEFHGLMFEVDRRVLVPRPDTETLVDWALELLRDEATFPAEPRVIDLGTGSGAIAVAVKHAWPAVRVVALDESAEALEVARANARRHAVDIDFRPSDWWRAVDGERFHIALSNPPYVADGDPHLQALGHEPIGALTSGVDGLEALRQLVAQAPRHLEAGGWLLLEHGHDQGEAVRALLIAAGFICTQTRRDLSGRERCSGGRTPPASV